MKQPFPCLGAIVTAVFALTFAFAADPVKPSFVTVGDKQMVVKSPPFTGKNEKVAKRNNTITLGDINVSPSAGVKGKGGQGKNAPADALYELTPDVVVRWQKLPELKDSNGKPIKRNFDEIQKLKGTAGLPGYEASLSDLAPNQVVTVRLARMKGSEGAAAEKLFVSRIIIQGELPAPKTEEPKKKKK